MGLNLLGRRDTHRFPFPQGARPWFLIDGAGHEVVDCSEGGLLYALPEGAAAPAVGQSVAGVLRLRHGPEVPVAGIVVRVSSEGVALNARGEPIPFLLLLAEQKYHRTRAPRSA